MGSHEHTSYPRNADTRRLRRPPPRDWRPLCSASLFLIGGLAVLWVLLGAIGCTTIYAERVVVASQAAPQVHRADVVDGDVAIVTGDVKVGSASQVSYVGTVEVGK